MSKKVRCSKVAYPSKQRAKLAMVAVARRFGNDMYVYKCNACHLWHLASKTEYK